MTTAVAPEAVAERVELPSGPVTLESIDDLGAHRSNIAAEIAAARAESDRSDANAQERFSEAGSILVVQRTGWDTSGVASELSAVDALRSEIDAIDAQLDSLANERPAGFSGFFARFGARNRQSALQKSRAGLASSVANLPTGIAAKAPSTTVPAADELLGPARANIAAAEETRRRADSMTEQRVSIDEELTRRRESVSKLGFDALWTAAWLQGNEPEAVEAPLVLQRGEVAWLAVPCTLARLTTRTSWVGRSQGASIPVGHTGIRYRVGSYQGHPVQSTSIADKDHGTLVLTNKRLVFVGGTKSVTTGLTHIVHVEGYADALGVFQDRRETPDFFKLKSPQHVLFYINYALTRLTG